MARSYSSPGGSHSRRSSRSSADYSDSSYLSSNPPQTPPTPHRLEGEPGGKYVFAEGHLVQTNLVPLPPFFPVPPSFSPSLPPSPSPSTMQRSFSHDLPSPHLAYSHKLGHSRKLSSDSHVHTLTRTRAASSASIRPPLSLLGSPLSTSTTFTLSTSTSSSASSTPLSSPLPPQDRPTVTFKVLHPESNLLIRLPRDGLSLEQLRHQVERKFALSAGIKLDGEDGQTQWALSYIKNGGRGSDPAAIAELIASEDDFKQALVHTSAQTKVSLRIVS